MYAKKNNSRMSRHSCCEVRVMQLHDILLLRTSASLHSVSVGAKPLSTGQYAPCRKILCNKKCNFLYTQKKWLVHTNHFLYKYIPSKLHIRNFLTSLPIHLTWLCPRPISNSQLHVLPHFHLCPIYLVVFKGSYNFRWDISSWGGLHA